ncbi:hypothetical protein CYPRO_0895 [Cyclonatronum proteinivorum]|uniref:Uncharacterized protein n=1 Tax=Cyclonatronum proteinivorum TaxID=1457365 RepID=A0A345UI70_9BACT|nr:hypothetical protein CYPRO_0895 [Cyclonatronum proteinivorum]
MRVKKEKAGAAETNAGFETVILSKDLSGSAP